MSQLQHKSRIEDVFTGVDANRQEPLHSRSIAGKLRKLISHLFATPPQKRHGIEDSADILTRFRK